jgi:hypothetical protein
MRRTWGAHGAYARRTPGAKKKKITLFGGVVAMKKGGKKYIIYVVSNSYVISNFYLEGVCKHKCGGDGTVSGFVFTHIRRAGLALLSI